MLNNEFKKPRRWNPVKWAVMLTILFLDGSLLLWVFFIHNKTL